MEKNLPQETGFYWAKTSGMKWFNAIVQVYGDFPFFKVVGWDRVKDSIIRDISVISEFGERIKESE